MELPENQEVTVYTCFHALTCTVVMLLTYVFMHWDVNVSNN